MPEHNATQRSREKAHGKGAERGHGAEQFIFGREKQLTEHQRGGGGVDVKVVPLDHGADECGGRGTARLGRSGRLHGAGSFGYFFGRRKVERMRSDGAC